MIFWISLGLLSLLAVLAIVWPLLRSSTSAGLNSNQSQLAVSRDRRLEIDADEQAGRLSATEAEEARQELATTLAREMSAESPGKADNASPRRVLTAAFVVALVPTAAFIAYQQVGEPELGANPAIAQANKPLTEDDLRAMAAELNKHTQANPNDADAWKALAQARRATGDAAGAGLAYGKAAALLPADSRLLADQAEMIAVTQGRQFAGKPADLLRQALSINAGDLKANALMAAVYMQAGQKPQAVPHLRIVLASMEPGSPDASQIATIIEGIEAENPTTGGGTPPVAAAQSSISGTIALSGEPVPAGAVLFISARAPSGPRIPYAALRITEPSLPMQFELSDANAMSPQRLLSSAGEVVVEARLSLSGDAIRKPGDRFGTSASVSPNTSEVMITIDQTVQ